MVRSIKYPDFGWEDMQKYDTENLDYADQARQLLSDELGFAPSIQASYIPEMYLRKRLGKAARGEMSMDMINNQVKIYAQVISRLILEQVPEQTHLVDRSILEE